MPWDGEIGRESGDGAFGPGAGEGVKAELPMVPLATTKTGMNQGQKALLGRLGIAIVGGGMGLMGVGAIIAGGSLLTGVGAGLGIGVAVIGGAFLVLGCVITFAAIALGGRFLDDHSSQPSSTARARLLDHFGRVRRIVASLEDLSITAARSDDPRVTMELARLKVSISVTCAVLKTRSDLLILHYRGSVSRSDLESALFDCRALLSVHLPKLAQSGMRLGEYAEVLDSPLNTRDSLVSLPPALLALGMPSEQVSEVEELLAEEYPFLAQGLGRTTMWQAYEHSNRLRSLNLAAMERKNLGLFSIGGG